MRNRYIRVLQMYWDRPLSSWHMGILALSGMIPIVISLVSRGRFVESQFSGYLVGVAFIGQLMWMQLREQVVSDRRWLWPRYLTPHCVVFSILSMLLVVAWPAAVGFFHGVFALGAMAVTAGLFAFMGWGTATLSWPVVFTGTLVLFWMICGAEHEPLRGFIRGEYPELSVAIMATGLLMAAGAVWRMTRITQDNPACNRRLQVDAWSLKPRVTGEVNQAWVETNQKTWFNRIRPQNQVYIPVHDTRWDRARRWRGLNRSMVRTVPWLAILWLALLGSTTLFGSSAVSNPMVSITLLFPLGIWLIVMPTFVTGGMWMKQWQFLEMEFLRPAYRENIILDIGLAMAIHVAQCWCVFALALSVYVLLPFGGQRSLNGLATALSASAMLQVFFFGLVVWLARFRSPSLNAFVLLAMMPASLVAAVIDPHAAYWRPAVLMGAFVLACVGIILIRAAYRRWLHTDIG